MRATVAAFLQNHLFRWRTDAPGSIRLDRRRVFILPTRHGLLFAATLLAMLLTAINYTLALGHALVFLLAGLCLTGILHTFRNLHGLLLTPGHCPPVFAGELANCAIVVGNLSERARRGIELQAAAGEPVRISLPAQAQRTVQVAFPSGPRGEHPLPRIRLQTTYPLGLLTAWGYLHPPGSHWVYPAPRHEPLPPARPATGAGSLSQQEGHEDFAGLRQHQPADPSRHVAWKASARDDGERPLLTKLFAGGEAGELRLDWQDCAAWPDPEIRLSVLCGWVLHADAAGLSYALVLPGQVIPPATGPAHRERCLTALAACRP